MARQGSVTRWRWQRGGALLWVAFVVAAFPLLAQETFVEEEEDPADFVAEPEAQPEAQPEAASEPAASEPAVEVPDEPVADEPDTPIERAPTAPKAKPKKPRKAPKKQAKPTDTKERSAPPKAVAAVDDEPPFAITKMSFDAVVERWDAYVKVLKAREVSRVRRFEAEFDQGRKAFGLHGLPLRPAAPSMGAGAALIAERHFRNGDVESGDSLMAQAMALAPDSPGIYLANARFSLAYKNDGPGAIRSTIAAAKAAFRDPTSRVTLIAWTVTVALFAFILWLVLLSIVFLARSFRMLTFDLHAALPRGAARWQVWLLVLAAAIAPILAGMGPLLVGLYWLSLAALYLARREQILLVVVASLCVAFPFAVDFAVTTWTWQQSIEKTQSQALFDVAADALRAELATKSPAALTATEEMALAASAKRTGELEEARTRWRDIVQRRPQDATAHASLGVVAGIFGEFELAKAELEAARKNGSEAKSIAYNLSLLHLRQGDSSKAQSEAAALADDPMLHEQFRAATFTGNDVGVPHNRAFVDPPLPMPAMEGLFASPPPSAARLSAEVRDLIWYGWSTTTAAGAAGGLLLLWLLLMGLSERLSPSQPCRRCGTPASERYDASDVPSGSCSGCFNVFESKTARVEPSRKAAKDTQIQQWRRTRHRLAVGLSLLWPGLGHLYAGATLMGVAFSVAYLPVVVTMVLCVGPFPWPGFSGLNNGYVFLGIAMALAACIVGLAAFLAHRKTE